MMEKQLDKIIDIMKIHIVTQTFPPRIGGMQTLMYSLAEGLSKKIMMYSSILIINSKPKINLKFTML